MCMLILRGNPAGPWLNMLEHVVRAVIGLIRLRYEVGDEITTRKSLGSVLGFC